MGAQSSVHLHNVPSHKLLRSRPTLTDSIWQIERKLYSVGEAIGAIFTDQESDNDNFDCGSDVEYCPDSEDVSANEENDMEDDSFVLPPSNFSQDVETVSSDQEGNCLPLELCRKFCFLYVAGHKIYVTCLFYMYILYGRQTCHRF